MISNVAAIRAATQPNPVDVANFNARVSVVEDHVQQGARGFHSGPGFDGADGFDHELANAHMWVAADTMRTTNITSGIDGEPSTAFYQAYGDVSDVARMANSNDYQHEIATASAPVIANLLKAQGKDSSQWDDARPRGIDAPATQAVSAQRGLGAPAGAVDPGFAELLHDTTSTLAKVVQGVPGMDVHGELDLMADSLYAASRANGFTQGVGAENIATAAKGYELIANFVHDGWGTMNYETDSWDGITNHAAIVETAQQAINLFSIAADFGSRPKPTDGSLPRGV